MLSLVGNLGEIYTTATVSAREIPERFAARRKRMRFREDLWRAVEKWCQINLWGCTTVGLWPPVAEKLAARD